MRRAIVLSALLLPFVAIVIATGCASLWAGSPQSSLPTRPSPPARETVVVKRAPITDAIRFLGRVSSAREANLYFTTSGRLKTVDVQVGDQVKEGQVLAELDTGDLPSRIEEARVALEMAIVKRDQERAKRGDPETFRETQIKEAEAAVRQAEASLQKAQAEYDKVAGGPDPVEVRAQEAAVFEAEQALKEAKEKHEALINGPSPEERRELEAAVEQARASLEAAQANRLIAHKQEDVAKVLRDREAEHAWYEKAYGEQKAKYDAGEISELELHYAWSNLLAAKERLDTARVQAEAQKRQADLAVIQAEDQLRKAEAELAEKTAPPSEDDVRASEGAVKAAEARLDAERVKLEEVRAGASEAERLAAEGAVLAAQAAVAKAEAEFAAVQAGTNQDFELQLLEKQVDQARVALEELESELAGSRIVAPFDGNVLQARGRAGDQVTEFQTVVVVADPNTLNVRTELADTDLEKVAIGHRVELSIDALPGTTLKGSVSALPSGLPSEPGAFPDQSLQIDVEWPEGNVELGMLARGQIIVQEKTDALVVPLSAIRTVGNRRFVEYFDGKARRGQNVQVGITTDTEAEILSGLTEGQVILAGP